MVGGEWEVECYCIGNPELAWPRIIIGVGRNNFAKLGEVISSNPTT
jgi:hypothetical protein